jgi:hypothetical protein
MLKEMGEDTHACESLIGAPEGRQVIALTSVMSTRC